MDEFNEKDQLGESAEAYPPAAKDTVPAEIPGPPEQTKPESLSMEAGTAPAPEEAPSTEAEMSPAPAEPPHPADERTPPPAEQQPVYWSGNRAGQQSAPPPYQGPYQQPGRAPYPPAYYQNGGGYPNGGYGYARQNPPYGQNAGYPSQGGYQQYGTSSGWQQQPPPPQEDRYEWKVEDYYDNLEKKQEKKNRNRGMVVFTVALVSCLCVGLLVLSAYSIFVARSEFETVTQSEAEITAPDEAAETPELPDSKMEITARPDYSETIPVGGKMTIPQVAETVLPSVAGVFNYKNNQMVEPSELGSGIVMNTDGYIITNAHVVEGGTGFEVQVHSGEIYEAVLVGADKMSDLAVLKIEAEGLIPARFGDSETVLVGETVVAIGNPAGLQLAGSVTQGIVSAVNRMVNDTNSMDYIQTDAAINPGNSGGALANEYGQVIGVNSSKIVAQGFEGIGFAIPISEAKPIIDELIASGRVASRAMLGIKGVAVDAMNAGTYGERGIWIAEFSGSEDLPANGVEIGDIITHVDGERIYTLADLRRVLDTKKAGDMVTLTLYRRLLNQETNFDVETRLVSNEGEQQD